MKIIKSYLKSIAKYIISYDFWQDLMIQNKVSDIIFEYFESDESDELQKLFLKNFSYPIEMKNDPIRYNGEYIYYTLNFPNKETFEDEKVLQTMFSQSLSILDKQLIKLGVTNFLHPNIEGQIEDYSSVLVTIEINNDISKFDIFLNILKHIVTILIITLTIHFII